MRMADACDVFGRGLELHRHHGLGDQLGRLRSDDVNAQNLIGLGIGQDLDHPGGVTHCARAAVRHEREGSRLVASALGLELLFRLPDPRDFRRGVDHPRHGVEVDVRVLTGDAFGHRHTFLFGLVRQHRPTNHVANRPDVGEVGAAIVIDLDEAPFIERQAHAARIQALGVGLPADRDDQPLTLELLLLASRIGIGQSDAVIAR